MESMQHLSQCMKGTQTEQAGEAAAHLPPVTRMSFTAPGGHVGAGAAAGMATGATAVSAAWGAAEAGAPGGPLRPRTLMSSTAVGSGSGMP